MLDPLEQHSRVHDPGRVEFRLGAAKRAGEQVRHFAQIPAAVVTPDSMVVGYRAAERRNRLRGRELDLIPLLKFPARAARREDRVVRRGAVGVHIGEPARDQAAAACLADRLPRGREHALVELPEAIPGDGRLEGLANQPEPDQAVTQVPATQERSPPDRGRVALSAMHLAAMAAADLQRPGQPRPQLVICRLKAEHEHRTRPVTASRQQCLVVAEQAAIGRIKPGLREFPGRLYRIGEVGEGHRGARPEPRPRLHAHPRLGDHAQRAFGAAEQPVRSRAGAGGRQPPGLQHAARRHYTDSLHELVDMGMKRREMATRARRYPSA
jgi:hypothetical protein